MTRVCCAIDFGTSNSAIALVEPAARRMRLVALEDAHVTMPTAVFHDAEDATRRYGRAAIAAFVDGREGRLMRSLKSILGSALVDETTHLGDGVAVRFIDVIAGFLRQLKVAAEREPGVPVTRAAIGRPCTSSTTTWPASPSKTSSPVPPVTESPGRYRPIPSATGRTRIRHCT